MGYFTFGELKNFVNFMSEAGAADELPVIVKIGENKICTLTGDDIYTDYPHNHPALDFANLPEKRMLFIQI